jgi:hypothetical protein
MILLPVSVEKNPLFTFTFVVFRRFVVSVLPVVVENLNVEAVIVDVISVEPERVE